MDLRCLAAFAQPAHTDRIDRRLFPGLETRDGNWAALLAASDGRVYVTLASHGGGGRLVYYESKTDRMRDAGNLNDLTVEAQLNRSPQLKIHARFGEGDLHGAGGMPREALPVLSKLNGEQS